MLAEDYIALDLFLTGELALDAQDVVRDADGTFATWQGFTASGPVRVDLRLLPAGDELTITRFDDDVETELDTEHTTRPSSDWAAAAIDRIGDRAEAAA